MQMSELPRLSQYLTILYCYKCSIVRLPDDLPATLQKIGCSDNLLTALPDHLPPQLQYINCSNNRLTALPDHLPPQLQEMYCNYNQLTALPNHLPCSLKVIHCQYNNLMVLSDKLPTGLIDIWCSYNKLTTLPDYLPPNLKTLWCDHNDLKVLPDLPDSLTNICTYGNPRLYKRYPRLSYIEGRERRDLTPVIQYVNEINSMWRITDRCTLLKPAIDEFFIHKTMHPRLLQPLLDDPDLVVDDFMDTLFKKAINDA